MAQQTTVWILFTITVCTLLQATDGGMAGPAIPPLLGGHLGCFKETQRRRTYCANSGAIKAGTLTPQKCYTLCGALKLSYAALAYGEICFCSNKTPNGLLVLETTKCTTPCVGDGTKTCGSATHVDVWESLTSIEISVTASPTVAKNGQQVSLAHTAIAQDPYKLSIDYGNMAGTTHYVTSGTGLMANTYHRSGIYKIKAYATNSDETRMPPVETGTNVLVQTEVNDVNITCDSVVATHEPASCNVAVKRGTDVTLAVQYTDGAGGTPVSKSFPIADSTEFTIGYSVLENLDPVPAAPTVNAGKIVHAGSPATHSGILVGFEYFAAATGQLDIWVYRPDCGASSYCSDSNLCEASCSRTCSTPGYCTSIHACCSGVLTKTTTLLTTYTKVATVAHSISTTGYGYFDVAGTFDISPGDILVHDTSSTGMLAQLGLDATHRPVGDFNCPDLAFTMTTLASVTCTSSTQVHQLQAIYADTSSVHIPLEFTSPGLVSISATVTNNQASIGGSEVDTATIDVQEGVDRAELDITGCIEAGVNVVLKVKSFTGSGVTVLWDFGNGNTQSVADATTVTYNYPNPGNYNVTVNISNAVSFKVNWTMVCAQEKVTDLQLSPVMSIAEVGKQVNFTLSMTRGSDFSCETKIRYTIDNSLDTFTATSTATIMPYTFDKFGDVLIQTTCVNLISTETYTNQIQAMERLTGVSPSPPGAEINVFFQITITWATGSNVTIVVVYDGVNVPMTINELERKATSGLKVENAIGGKPISVTVSNAMDTVSFTDTFFIEVAIDNAVLSCVYNDPYTLSTSVPYEVIKLNSGVDCTVTMDAGTSVVVTIEWGDGTLYNGSIPRGIDWSAGTTITQPIQKTFTSQGYFAVKFTVQNSFNKIEKYFPSMVQVPVDSTALNTPPLPVLFAPPAYLTFTWTVTTGPVPENITCDIKWGDKNQDVISNCDVSQNLLHTYWDMQGELNLTYTLSNLISEKAGWVLVKILSPIVDFTCLSSPLGVAPNTNVNLVAKMQRGPGADILDMTFDCDTAVAGTKPTRKRETDSPDGEDIEVCNYPAVGVYSTSIRAVSDLEDKTCTYDLKVLNPVTDEFTVWSSAPIDYSFTTNCVVTFRLDYTGTPLPDDASVVYEYGDGQNSTVIPFATANVPTDHTYSYSSPGHYTTTIRIYNIAGEITRLIPSGCYERFDNVQMTVLRQPELPRDSPDLVGFGPNQDIFSVQENIKIHTTKALGTLVWWDITAVSDDNVFFCNSTDQSILTYSIPAAGTYNLSIQAKNPLHESDAISMTIQVINLVKDIFINQGSITNPNQYKTFTISMTSYGTDMCVATTITGVDESWVYLYGSASSICQMDTYRWAIGQYDSGMNVSVAFDVAYNFTKKGTYSISVVAWNEFSNTSTSSQFVVTQIDCSTPNINIEQGRADFKSPVTILRSKRIKLVGKTDINCPKTLKNQKLWTGERWNAQTNEVISVVDFSTVPSRQNAELSIDPLVLPYGLYKFTFKVTMTNTGSSPGTEYEEFSSTAVTFVDVVKTDIIVQLFANSVTYKTVGPNAELTLAPRLYSFDPDVDTATGTNNVFDTLQIACRDVTLGEEFPSNTAYVTPYSNLAAVPGGHVDTGGCFQQGPGWFNPFTDTLTFNTDILKTAHTYEFKVVAEKDTRSSFCYSRVEVAALEPPDVTIIFKIPGIYQVSPTGRGKQFSPNLQQGLVAEVVNPCAGCTYTYEWEMFAEDYNYKAFSNGWRSLAYLLKYIQGTQSQELTVLTDVFSHYSEVNNFQIRLQATNTATGAVGKVSLDLVRNKPPSGGNCTISPLEGEAFKTNFTVECSGFTDDLHQIADYQISCISNGRSTDVCSGLNTVWEYRYLPVGDEANNYTLQCYATVTDEFGSAGTYPIHTVQVRRMSMTDLRQQITSMASSENDRADVVDAHANLDETISYCSTISSLLEQMSKNDEFEEFVGIGTAASYQSTTLDDTSVRPSAFQATNFSESKKEEYEDIRDNTAHLIDSVVTTLTKCTVESIQETKLLTDTVASLSNSREHLVKETQSLMLTLATKAVNNMKKNMETLSVEELQSIGQGVMETCANIEDAGVLNAEHPTKTDLATEEKNVPYFPTNKDSKTPDIPISKNDKDALKSGKTILNKEDQHALVSTVRVSCNTAKDDIFKLLVTVKPASPIPTILKTSSYEVSVTKSKAGTLVDQTVATSGGNVAIPADALQGTSADDVLVMAITTRASAGITTADGPVNRYSRELTVSFTYPDGSPRQLTNLPTPVTLGISQDPNRVEEDINELIYSNPVIVESREEEYLFFHQVWVSQTKAAVQFVFRPTNISRHNQLLVLINKDTLPRVGPGQPNVKKVCMIPNHTDRTGQYGSDTEADPYTCFLDADIVERYGPGLWKIGVRQLNSTEINAYSVETLHTSVPVEWKRDKKFNQDYRLRTVIVTCAYSRAGSTLRKTDGVTPSALSTSSLVVCLTTHLTSFAGGWAVAPNTLDWDFIFSNADFFKNPTLYITEIVIIVFYILAMIWARHRDKQDVEKLGLAPLADNDPRDKYYYEIMVNTGMRRNAGTESKVHFILSGEEDETDVRTFSDKKRKIFQRGNTDGFLMAVEFNLGALSYLRVWHDNSGKGKCASWYLNHIVIRDVQTDKKYYFIANKWFAVEEDDGQVDRVIPVAGKEQMTEFGHLFQERASKNLSDGHLWFSVVARPPASRFTRCQRVSACLCLLFTSMLANALFYEVGSSEGTAFTFGPFALSPEQIYIGVATNLIIFPINFIIITLFRKSRPRKLRPSRVEEALRSNPERTTSMTDVNPRVKSSMSHERPGSSFLMEPKRSQSSLSRPESSMSTKIVLPTKKKKKCELPWWFVIVAWILLALTVLVAMAFTTFYGIMFQDMKCKKWISSMFISFFTSVFFTQPIKVFLFAIIFSLIIKNPGGDEEEDDDEEPSKPLETDEEFLHEDEQDLAYSAPKRPLYKPKPPDQKTLDAARDQRMKEIKMWAVIREILFYVFYLWVLLVISYKSVSTDSYNYKYNMQKVFILTNDTKHAFSKVKNVQDFWVWARSGMLRGLRAGPYYNNYPPFYLRGYINDKVSRLMGYATLRQVRIKPDSCTLPHQVESVIKECNAPYDIALEDTGDYGAGWTSPASVNNTREEYTHLDGSSLNSYPYWGEMAMYGGGGYLVRLNQDYFSMVAQFQQLEAEKWIDKYTRAVFLEFTVYNPSINLFSVSTLLSEFRPSGGVFPSFRFEPCRLLPYVTNVLLFQIACEIMYMLFTLVFVFNLVRNLYKQRSKYFLQFWNVIDLCVVSLSVTAIVVYFYRLVCINELTAYFNETQGNGYMNFQYVGYWSEIFNYIIGFLVFFASLKFLKLLRFNKRISLLADTLKNSGRDLLHFSIIFNIIFMAFIQVFYLVYHGNLDIFKTLVSSAEAGIVMMMGKFDIYNMQEVNQWFTQIFLFLFVISITFIVVNMFLSILNDTFGAVRENASKQQNDYEIIDFMMGRFKLWTGLGRAANTTISPVEMENERNKQYRTLEGQIDYFPNQIDRFLASISHMYMEKSKFDDFLHKGAMGKMAMKAQSQNAPFNSNSLHPPPKHPGATRLSSGSRGMTDVQTD